MARGSTVVLIHSSKTMRSDRAGANPTRSPALLDRAHELVEYLRTLTPRQLGTVMTLSGPMAAKTHELFADWSTAPAAQSPAVETFTGDIYSGLQAALFGTAERRYADGHLRILSGLYGLLRPYDGICPYRLEMGFRLPDPRYGNLYRFWGSAIADELPDSGLIVNLAANEYSKVVLDHVDRSRVVTPRFLTVDPRSGEAKFVVVHAKIARGAFARWLITRRIGKPADLGGFGDLGYRLDPDRGSPREPCYVCSEFEGKGLSVRLQ
jgi:cytoplasmic iron level regulating protein YaaA (DUF328/UPF0246 family)